MVPVPASTGPPGYGVGRRFQGHMCLRSPDMAKMDHSATDVAFALWNGIVQDARRHAHQ
jgi:hypothetical protein